MGKHGAMRRFGRRAAIGATTVALLLAATGTSLAAVRAARQDGVASSGLDLSASAAKALGSGTRTAPAAGRPNLGSPGSGGPASPPGATSAPGAPAGEAPGTSTAPTSPAAPPTSQTQPGGLAPQASTRSPLVPPVKIGGPGPTLPPGAIPTPDDGCPSDAGRGALPPGAGELRAVDFTLAWPARGPLVLLPQASGPRAAGAQVRILGSTSGLLATDGSSLTLDQPLTTGYSLVAGTEVAHGTVRFNSSELTIKVNREACRDRSFVLHDVAEASLEGRPLRIVGVVAPAGTITLDEHGGIARFRSSASGRHMVTMVTANDAGAGGPLIEATVTVP